MNQTKIKDIFKKIFSSKVKAKAVPIALCAAAVILLLLLALLLFPVKEFEVEGNTKYDLNEIVDASGIRTGNRLFFVNERRVEKNIVEGCPYVKNVKIKRKLPNKICFVIEERVAGWYVQVGDDFYSMDYDLKVLLESFDEQGMIDRGLTKLVLPELESVVMGELPRFGEGDERLIAETLKIIDTVRTHSIKERLTMLDLSNRFQIKMMIDGAYTVDFGDMKDSETKFDMIDQIISTAALKGYVGGQISVVNPSEHSFRGVYPDEIPTDEAESEEQ